VREVSFLHGREHARKEIADALFGLLRGGVPADLRGRNVTRGAILRPLPGAPGGGDEG